MEGIQLGDNSSQGPSVINDVTLDKRQPDLSAA